jgi:hypothetical protein
MATELARLGLARAYHWKGRPERPVGPLQATRAQVASLARAPEPPPRKTQAATPAAPRVTLNAAAEAMGISRVMLRDWLLEGAPVLDLAAIVAWRSAQAACGAREPPRKRGMQPQPHGAHHT